MASAHTECMESHLETTPDHDLPKTSLETYLILIFTTKYLYTTDLLTFLTHKVACGLNRKIILHF